MNDYDNHDNNNNNNNPIMNFNRNNSFGINDHEKIFFNEMFNMMENFERGFGSGGLGSGSGFMRNNIFDEFTRGGFGSDFNGFNNHNRNFQVFDISDLFNELNNNNFRNFSGNQNQNYSQENINSQHQKPKNIKYSDNKIYDV